MSDGRAKGMGVDFAQFVHGGPDEPDEICYLYHLDPPLKHAQHYLGTTELGIEERGSPGIGGARLLESISRMAVAGTWCVHGRVVG